MNRFHTVRCVEDAQMSLKQLTYELMQVQFHLNRIADEEDKQDARLAEMQENIRLLSTTVRVLNNEMQEFMDVEYERSQKR